MTDEDKNYDEGGTLFNFTRLCLNIYTGFGALFLDTIVNNQDSKISQRRNYEVESLAQQTDDAI